MSGSWNPAPLITDPGALQDQMLAALVAALPGYVPRESALDTAIVAIVASMVAQLAQAVEDFADLALATAGPGLFQVPVQVGVASAIPVTITSTQAGETLPATYSVIGTTTAGLAVAFTLGAPLTLTGTSTTAILTAITTGAAANGVPAGALSAQSATQTVTAVTASAPSSGGIDAETPDDYLARLQGVISTLSPGIVQASGVSAVARAVAGVQRTLAANLYDVTASPPTPVARAVTVWGVDSTGAPLAAAVKTALAARLAASREVNFIFRLADPTYTALTVAFTAVAKTGYANATVTANIVAAITAAISPATFAGTVFDDAGVAVDWQDNAATVRWGAVLAAAYGADGCAYVSNLTINGGQVDVALPGRAPLPAAVGTGSGQSQVSGTVTGGS